MTLSEQQMADKSKEKMSNGGVNGIVETAATSQPPPPPATILGPNTPRTFLILQQQTPQQARLGFPQQGQRLLLAIQRPGGVIQHVAMPANVVAITSSQLQTNGAAVVTLTSSGLGTVNREQLVASNGQVSSVSLSTNGLPVRSTAQQFVRQRRDLFRRSGCLSGPTYGEHDAQPSGKSRHHQFRPPQSLHRPSLQPLRLLQLLLPRPVKREPTASKLRNPVVDR